MKILVVDDDDFSAQVMVGSLRNLGFEVDRGKTGSEALTHLVNSGSDIRLVISDVYMPGMTGLDLFQTLRSHATLSEMPMILMSGLTDIRLITEAAKMGCKHILVKPITREKLLAKIQEIMPLPRLWLKDPQGLMEELGISLDKLCDMISQFHALAFRIVESCYKKNEDPAKGLAPLIELARIIGTDELNRRLDQYLQGAGSGASLQKDMEDLVVDIDAMNDHIVVKVRKAVESGGASSGEVQSQEPSVDGVGAQAEPKKEVRRSYTLAYSENLVAIAESGDPQAQYDLGLVYQRGYGADIHDRNAEKWYEKAAGQNHPGACARLGLIALHSKSATQELTWNKALEFFKKGAEFGSEECLYWADRMTQNSRESLDFLILAKLGDPVSQNKLGLVYRGTDFPADNLEAMFWFNLSAKQGYLHGQYNLGVIHLEGKANGASLREAHRLFKEAAEFDHADALYSLGRMYHLGMGVEADVLRAIQYYEKGARQGNVLAQFELGYIYESGPKGVKSDIKQALKWYLVNGLCGSTAASKKVPNLKSALSSKDMIEVQSQANTLFESIQPNLTK